MLLEGVWLALSWFAFYAVAHVLLMRRLRPQLYFAAAFRLWLVVLAGYLSVSWTTAGLRGGAWLSGAVFFASLWVWYMIVTFNVARSVSLRTLTELARAPNGTLTEQELDRLYEPKAMFDRRLDSMVANGYLIERNGALTLTEKGRVTARIATLVRRLLNIQHYG